VVAGHGGCVDGGGCGWLNKHRIMCCAITFVRVGILLIGLHFEYIPVSSIIVLNHEYINIHSSND